MAINKLKYVEETRMNWHAGMLSFIGQRVTGVALVLYLVLHIYSLASILGGGESFRTGMANYDTMLFRTFEWFLLAAVVFHMLNGLRIVAVDWLGITRLQRGMFWAIVALSAVVCLASIPFFFVWR